MVAEWLRELTLEQLPEPYKTMANEIGVDGALKMAKLYQGTGFYLPKLDGLLAELRNERIKKEFDGGNYKELARRYELSERWIYEIIGHEADENQVSFY